MPRTARAQRNMQFFREVNEGIHRHEERWVSSEPICFVCECAELGCHSPVFLTAKEFRDVRRERGHFVARPDHVDRTNDAIVLATDRYVVVTLESALPADAAALNRSG